MNLAEIQNGLAFAGNTRKRNYRERACAANDIRTNPSYGQKQQQALLIPAPVVAKFCARYKVMADELTRQNANK